MSDKPRAFLAADKKTFTMKVGTWSGNFPVQHLDQWIEFYKAMAARKHPRFGTPDVYRNHYQPKVDVLVSLKRRLEGVQCNTVV